MHFWRSQRVVAERRWSFDTGCLWTAVLTDFINSFPAQPFSCMIKQHSNNLLMSVVMQTDRNTVTYHVMCHDPMYWNTYRSLWLFIGFSMTWSSLAWYKNAIFVCRCCFWILPHRHPVYQCDCQKVEITAKLLDIYIPYFVWNSQIILAQK